MSVRRMIGAAAAVGVLSTATLIGFTAAASAQEYGAKWVTLSASGSGDDEVPSGSGEKGTKITGSFQLKATGELNYTVTVTGNSETITAGHIHKGAAGANGDVVIPLDEAAINDGTSATTQVDPAVAERIIANPQNYYLNAHSPSWEPPTGVARGQLTGDAEQPNKIDTGNGGQAAAADDAASTGVALAGAGVLLAGAVGGAVAVRRRSSTDRA